jgi:amino acid efflux transporter
MSGLVKSLNVYQGTGILVSTLLGSGIFIIPAMAATIAGPRSLIAWALTIAAVLPVAFTFSALGVKHPHAGGTAFFIRKAYGERFDNLTSWLYLSVVPIGPPVVIVTGASYLGGVFGVSEATTLWISVAMIGVMFSMNVFGLRVAGFVQTVVSGLVVTLLLTIVIAAFARDPGLVARQLVVPASSVDIPDIAQATSVIFWCFVGLEAIAHLSSEFRDVEVDFPRTIVASIAIVGTLCLLLSAVVLCYGAYGSERMNARYVTYLAERLFGRGGAYVVGVACFLTCFATVNLYLLSFSRLMFSMSRNGVIPQAFSRTSVRGVPLHALAPIFALVLATVVLKFALGVDLNSLVLYGNGIFVSLYLLAAVAGVALLRRTGRALALASVVVCGALLLFIGPRAFYAAIVCALSLSWDFLRASRQAPSERHGSDGLRHRAGGSARTGRRRRCRRGRLAVIHSRRRD